MGTSHTLNQVVNITFTTKGTETVLARAKEMSAQTKKEIATLSREIKALQNPGTKGYGSADWSRQLKESTARLKDLQTTAKAWELSVNEGERKVSVLNDGLRRMGELGVKSMTDLSNLTRRFQKNLGDLARNGELNTANIENTRKAAIALEQEMARLAQVQKGVLDPTKALGGKSTYIELRNHVEWFEKYGKASASTRQEYEAMGRAMLENKIRMEQLTGSLRKLNDASSTQDVQGNVRAWQQISQWAQRFGIEIDTGKQSMSELGVMLKRLGTRSTMQGLSTAELQDDLRMVRQLGDAVTLDSKAQEQYNSILTQGNRILAERQHTQDQYKASVIMTGSKGTDERALSAETQYRDQLLARQESIYGELASLEKGMEEAEKRTNEQKRIGLEIDSRKAELAEVQAARNAIGPHSATGVQGLETTLRELTEERARIAGETDSLNTRIAGQDTRAAEMNAARETRIQSLREEYDLNEKMIEQAEVRMKKEQETFSLTGMTDFMDVDTRRTDLGIKEWQALIAQAERYKEIIAAHTEGGEDILSASGREAEELGARLQKAREYLDAIRNTEYVRMGMNGETYSKGELRAIDGRVYSTTRDGRITNNPVDRSDVTVGMTARLEELKAFRDSLAKAIRLAQTTEDETGKAVAKTVFSSSEASELKRNQERLATIKAEIKDIQNVLSYRVDNEKYGLKGLLGIRDLSEADTAMRQMAARIHELNSQAATGGRNNSEIAKADEMIARFRQNIDALAGSEDRLANENLAWTRMQAGVKESTTAATKDIREFEMAVTAAGRSLDSLMGTKGVATAASGAGVKKRADTALDELYDAGDRLRKSDAGMADMLERRIGAQRTALENTISMYDAAEMKLQKARSAGQQEGAREEMTRATAEMEKAFDRLKAVSNKFYEDVRLTDARAAEQMAPYMDAVRKNISQGNIRGNEGAINSIKGEINNVIAEYDRLTSSFRFKTDESFATLIRQMLAADRQTITEVVGRYVDAVTGKAGDDAVRAARRSITERMQASLADLTAAGRNTDLRSYEEVNAYAAAHSDMIAARLSGKGAAADAGTQTESEREMASLLEKRAALEERIAEAERVRTETGGATKEQAAQMAEYVRKLKETDEGIAMVTERLDAERDALGKMNALLAREAELTGQVEEMERQQASLAGSSDEAMIRRKRELTEELQTVRQQIEASGRAITELRDRVTSGSAGKPDFAMWSRGDIEQAMKLWQDEMRRLFSTDGTLTRESRSRWEALNSQYQDAARYLAAAGQAERSAGLERTFANLRNIDDSGLRDAVLRGRQLRSEMQEAGRWTEDLNRKLEFMQKVSMQRREGQLGSQYQSIMGMGNVSDTAIQGTIRSMQQLQAEYEAAGKHSENLGRQIGALQSRLQERSAMSLESRYAALGTLSPEGIQNLLNDYRRLRSEMEAGGRDASALALNIRNLEGLIAAGSLDRRRNELAAMKDAVRELSDEGLSRLIGRYRQLHDEMAAAGRGSDVTSIQAYIRELETVSDHRAVGVLDRRSSRALDMSDEGLRQLIKDMQAYDTAMETSGRGVERYAGRIRELNAELARRNGDAAMEGGLKAFGELSSGAELTLGHMKELVMQLRQYREVLTEGSMDEPMGIRETDAAIAGLEKRMRSTVQAARELDVQHVFESVTGGSVSTESLQAALNRFRQLRGEWEQDGRDASDLTAKMEKMEEMLRTDSVARAREVLSSPLSAGTEEFTRSIRTAEDEVRRMAADGDEEWKVLTADIARARAEVTAFNSEARKVAMETQLGESTGSASGVMYANQADLSVKALQEQIAYWKELAALPKATAQEVEEYSRRVGALEGQLSAGYYGQWSGRTERLRDGSGNINRAMMMGMSTSQIEELTKLGDLTKGTLGTDSGLFKQITEDLKALREAQREAEHGAGSLEKALAAASLTAQRYESGESMNDRTVRQMQEAKKELEYFRDEVAKTNETYREFLERQDILVPESELRNIREGAGAIEVLNGKIADLGGTIRASQKGDAKRLDPGTFSDILKIASDQGAAGLARAIRNGKISIDDLTHAQQQLNREVKAGNLSAVGDDFRKAGAALRMMDGALKDVNRDMREHANTLANAFDRLKNYVLIYVGFQQAVDKVREFMQHNIELSDSIADIQKVSGMTRTEVDRLSDSLARMNTRSSQSELLKIAFQGGKLGIASTGGAKALQDFTEAAEKLNTALGADFGGADAIGQLTKLVQTMGLAGPRNRDIGEVLERTGSAILDLGNNSTASYAFITRFATRLGSVGTLANMQMPEILALGATIDTMGLQAEMASTALTRLIARLSQDPKAIAEAVRMSGDELRRFNEAAKEGDTATELQMLFRTMFRHKNDLGDIANRMKDIFGGTGTNSRGTAVIAGLANRSQEFDRLLARSRAAYEENAELEENFEIVNNNAAASMERIGNAIREEFVNSDVMGLIEDVLDSIVPFFENMDRYKARITGMIVGVGVAFKTVLAQSSVTWSGFKAAVVAGLQEIRGMLAKGGWTALLMAVSYTISAIIDKCAEAVRLSEDISRGVVQAIGKYVEQAAKVNTLRERYDELRMTQNRSQAQQEEFIRVQNRLNDVFDEYISKEELAARGIDTTTDSVLNQGKAYELLAAKIRKAEMARVGERMRADSMTEAQNDFSERMRKLRDSLTALRDSLPEAERRNWDINDIMAKETENFSRVLGDTSGSASMVHDQRIARLQKRAQAVGSDTGASVFDQTVGFIPGATWVKNGLSNVFGREPGDRNNSMASQWSKNNGAGKILSVPAANLASGTAGLVQSVGYLANGLANIWSGQDWSHDNSFREIWYGKGSAAMAGTYMEDMSSAAAKFSKDSKLITDVFGLPEEQLEDMADTRIHEALSPTVKDKDLKSKFKGYLDEWVNAVEAYYRNMLSKAETDFAQDPTLTESWLVMQRESIGKEKEQAHQALMAYASMLSNDEAGIQRSFKGENGYYGKDMQAYFTKVKVQFQKSLEDIRDFVNGSDGKALRDDIVKEMERFGQEVSRKAADLRVEVMRIILEDRPIQQLIEGLSQDLFRIDYLIFKEYAPEEIRNLDNLSVRTQERVLFLLDQCKRSYTMTADELLEAMRQKGFSSWADALAGSPEDQRALLIKMQGFYDSYEETARKAGTRLSKVMDMRWKTDTEGDFSGGTLETGSADDMERYFYYLANGRNMSEFSVWEGRKRRADDRSAAASKAEDWGVGGASLSGVTESQKAAIDAYDVKIAASQAWIAQLRLETAAMQQRVDEDTRLARMGAEQAHEQRLRELESLEEGEEKTNAIVAENAAYRAGLDNIELQAKMDKDAYEQQLAAQTAEKTQEINQMVAEQSSRMVELYGSVIGQLKPYGEELESFGSAFGEAVFGSRKDRQEAAKDLLRDVIRTTGSIVTQWLIMLATRRIQMEMEVDMERYKQAMITAEFMKAEAQRLGTEKAMLAADTAASTAEGIGKEVAREGLIGFAVGAAITAGMALLMGLAMGKIKDAENTLGGAGKLSTGMLTYSGGKYPEFSDGASYSVEGDDGNRYEAKYTDGLRTGVYHGPHMAVFSERGDEMVIDHDTLERMPGWMLSDIMALHSGRAVVMDHAAVERASSVISGGMMGGVPFARGLRTYAAGNVDRVLGDLGSGMADGGSSAPGYPSGDGSQAALAGAVRQLSSLLASMQQEGISANIFLGGEHGLDRKQQKYDRWKARNGVR